MAEGAPRERLQPALLDRLTDQEPDKKVETRDRRVLSLRRLKDGVLRDLGWLLNTSRLEAVEDLEPYPAVRTSVLNYGIPDFSGLVASGIDTAALEKAVHESIVRFEPRIAASSLKVTVTMDRDKMSRNAMLFRIEGELWAEPTPLALYLKTELDLETGDISVAEA